MSIEGRDATVPAERIRLGMVGGGEGAFIGAVHRLAARMDDQYVFVAGALSASPEKARRSGAFHEHSTTLIVSAGDTSRCWASNPKRRHG